MSLKLSQALAMGALVLASLQSEALISGETKKAAEQMGASTLAEVSFDQKKATLSDAEKKELSDLVKEARAKGEIGEIKVLVWADQEYPMDDQKVSKSEVTLAESRAKEIKTYLNSQLNVKNVNLHNMAERPNRVEKMLNTSDAKVKETAEASGAAPRSKDETGFFGLKGQASKALALVFMK